MLRLTLFILLVGALPQSFLSQVSAADDMWKTLQADAEIRFAGEVSRELAEQKPSEAADQRLARLRSLAEKVRNRFRANVLLNQQLTAALKMDDVASLKFAVGEAVETIQFRLKQEADLPEGFPEPTPVGEFRLKEYPAYRLARTASKQDSAFFTLFAHITANRIEMTAPVQINYRTNADNGDRSNLEQVDMAFLYGKPTVGKPGKTLLGVEVQDVPARKTVSLGLKGDMERTKLATYEPLLESWLEREAPEYERDGALRLMGYNSPQVPAEQRYFEVELPIKRK